MAVGIRTYMIVRATGTAGLGAGPKRLIEDRLDGARAAAALGAAAETIIDLLGTTRRFVRIGHRMAYIVVAEDVTGTDDHETGRTFKAAGILIFKYSRPPREAKGKTVF